VSRTPVQVAVEHKPERGNAKNNCTVTLVFFHVLQVSLVVVVKTDAVKTAILR
jgi:hypothetical protein